MYLFFILLGIGFCISVAFYLIDKDDWSVILGGTIISAIVSFIICLVINVGFLDQTKHFERIEYVSSTKELLSLKDNGSVGGSFFLGCGSINSEMRYYCYVKDGKYSVAETYRISGTYILEDDSETPRIEVIKLKYKPITKPWIHFRREEFKRDFTPTKTVFIIPEGSLLKDFQLDAE
jgi:hypothetical protein